MLTKNVFMLLIKKSKATFFLTCFSITLFLSHNGMSQAANGKPVYVAVNYIKVHPGKQGLYLDMLKTYSKKIYEYNFKQGRSIGVYISSMVLPTGSAAEYDITLINVSTDLKYLVDDSLTGKDLFKKVFPDYSDAFIDLIQAQYREVRTLVKKEIFTVLAEIDATAPPTKYYTVDYMKTAPNKAEDYVKLEKELWMPIHKERIKMGVLTDWLLLQKDMPYSASDAYDYETVNFFNNISFLQDAKYTEAIKKAFPNTDVAKSLDSTNTSRTIVSEELWKNEFYVDATNTKK
jgi:hypothetical protein